MSKKNPGQDEYPRKHSHGKPQNPTPINKENNNKNVFSEAMKGVSPLEKVPFNHPEKPKITEQQKQQRQHRAKHFQHEQPHLSYSAGYSSYKPICGDATIEFHRSALPAKQLKQLKRGQIEMDATLDLHSYTVAEAAQQLDQFMSECQQRKLYCVRIIHGKGQMSDREKPVLKNFTNDYLRQHKNVLAFHTAQQKHGGTGAVYVLLGDY